jgi:hypothetical protein
MTAWMFAPRLSPTEIMDIYHAALAALDAMDSDNADSQTVEGEE